MTCIAYICSYCVECFSDGQGWSPAWLVTTHSGLNYEADITILSTRLQHCVTEMLTSQSIPSSWTCLKQATLLQQPTICTSLICRISMISSTTSSVVIYVTVQTRIGATGMLLAYHSLYGRICCYISHWPMQLEYWLSELWSLLLLLFIVVKLMLL